MALTTMKNLQQFLNRIVQGNYSRNFGMQGGMYIADTAVHTFRAQAIKCSAASAVRFTSLKTVTGDDMTGMELLAGDVIYGDFTEIQIDTGVVYAYSKS